MVHKINKEFKLYWVKNDKASNSYLDTILQERLKLNILFVFLISVVTLLSMLVLGIHSFDIICAPATIIASYGLTYFLATNKQYYAKALAIVLLIPIPVIFYLAIVFPEIKYEAFLCLPLAIASLVFIQNKKWAFLSFTAYFLILIGLLIYQFYTIPLVNSQYASSINFIVCLASAAYTAVTLYLVAETFYIVLNNLKANEQILSQSEAQYRNLFANSFDAIFVYDSVRDHVILYNEAFEKKFEVKLRKDKSPIHKQDITPNVQADGRLSSDFFKENIASLKKYHKPIRLNILHKKFNDEVFETETTILPINQKNEQFVVIVRDISEKVKSDNLLKERERLLNALVENAFDGIEMVEIIHKKDGSKYAKEVLRNSRLSSMLGYEVEEVPKDVDPLDISPEYQKNGERSEIALQNVMKEMSANAKPQEPFQYQYNWTFEHKSKDPVEVESTVSCFYINKRRFMLTIVKDVTEKIQTEDTLREREALFSHLFNNAYDGLEILKVMPDNSYSYFLERNQKYRDFFGRTDEELAVANAMLLYAPPKQANGQDSHEYFYKHLNPHHGFDAEGKMQAEWQICNKKGEIVDTEIAVYELKVENGPSYVIATMRDISKTKRQEKIIKSQLKVLNRKNKELKKYIDSNMQLENFAYIASHDLQAPLRSITSFTQVLESSLADRLLPEEKSYMDFVVSGTKNMQKLIMALLTFSRVNTTKRTISEVQLSQLFDWLLLDLKSNIEEKQANITINNMPKTIRGDQVKLKQLLQNLIANALKFVKEDVNPKIIIECVEKDAHWQFSVQDNGIGIEEEYQEKIFLLFKRLHRNSEYEGTGIGLSLCKKLVEQHEGDIWLKSAKDEGSIFYFTIKKDLQDPTPESEEEEINSQIIV